MNMEQGDSVPFLEQAHDPDERRFTDWVWIEFTERGERIWIENHGYPPRRDSEGRTRLQLFEAAEFFAAHFLGNERHNVLEGSFRFAPPGYDWRSYEQ
jgi:hypothetical protein